MWCIGKINAEYQNRMYDILDLYNEPYDAKKPVIGVDEKPKQLLGEKRKPIFMKPGRSERYDYEYVRNGSANIFVAADFKAGKRFAEVTDHRCKPDFARFMKRLAARYPHATRLRVVLDNLNTHFMKSFYEAFGEKEAKKLLKRFEFHYTPKHASWLNVAEIEIGVMDTECTRRRISDRKTLAREVHAWRIRRNRQGKKIDWRFTRKEADLKLGKHYVT